MKNQILLENYYLPSELEHRIAYFVEYYNTQHYFESVAIYFGRASAILVSVR